MTNFLRLRIPRPPLSLGLHTISQFTLYFPLETLSHADQRKTLLKLSNLHENLYRHIKHGDEVDD
jgi:hypothetical protein